MSGNPDANSGGSALTDLRRGGFRARGQLKASSVCLVRKATITKEVTQMKRCYLLPFN